MVGSGDSDGGRGGYWVVRCPFAIELTKCDPGSVTSFFDLRVGRSFVAGKSKITLRLVHDGIRKSFWW